MNKPNLAVLVLVVLSACSRQETPPVAPVEPADHVFRGGTIHTADLGREVVAAVATRGKRIVYAGDASGVEELIGEHTRMHELAGRMLLPGLHDTHIHALRIVDSGNCDLEGVPKSLAEIVSFAGDCLQRMQKPGGEWLRVEQWNYAIGNEPSLEHRTLRAALDAVSEEHPIALLGMDGHHGAFNSVALGRARNESGEQIGLNRRTLAAEFARYIDLIAVDADGEPSGAVHEHARELLDPVGYGAVFTPPERLPQVSRRLAESGITTIQDASVWDTELSMYENLADSGTMTFRAHLALIPEFEDYRGADGAIDRARIVEDLQARRQQLAGQPLIEADAAKIFVDGVLEGDPLAIPPTLPNAAQLENYLQPQFAIDFDARTVSIRHVDTASAACRAVRAAPAEYQDPARGRAFEAEFGHLPAQCRIGNGVLEEDEQFILDYMRALDAAGFRIHAHTVGDRAARVTADGFEALRKANGVSGLQHSIAHAQLVHPDDQSRLGKMGIGFAMTFAWVERLMEYDMTIIPFLEPVSGVEDLYREEGYYLQNVYPAATLQEAGALIAAGSDAPVDTRDPRPFVNIARAVSRSGPSGGPLGPHQGLSIQDAIAAYTRNGARLLQRADTGVIAEGMLADLVVVDRDLLQLAATGRAAEIEKTRVLLTLFDGRIVYEAD